MKTIEINTFIKPTEQEIIQTVNLRMDDIQHQIMRDVLLVREEQIRAALVKLGWTPPSRREAGEGEK